MICGNFGIGEIGKCQGEANNPGTWGNELAEGVLQSPPWLTLPQHFENICMTKKWRSRRWSKTTKEN